MYVQISLLKNVRMLCVSFPSMLRLFFYINIFNYWYYSIHPEIIVFFSSSFIFQRIDWHDAEENIRKEYEETLNLKSLRLKLTKRSKTGFTQQKVSETPEKPAETSSYQAASAAGVYIFLFGHPPPPRAGGGKKLT